jgi:hypothetical protein
MARSDGDRVLGSSILGLEEIMGGGGDYTIVTLVDQL